MPPPRAPARSKAAESATAQAARSNARAREAAGGRERSPWRERPWARSGPAAPPGLPRGGAGPEPRGAACEGRGEAGALDPLAHGEQGAPHERARPLGPLLLEHQPDRVTAACEVELVRLQQAWVAGHGGWRGAGSRGAEPPLGAWPSGVELARRGAGCAPGAPTLAGCSSRDGWAAAARAVAALYACGRWRRAVAQGDGAGLWRRAMAQGCGSGRWRRAVAQGCGRAMATPPTGANS